MADAARIGTKGRWSRPFVLLAFLSNLTAAQTSCPVAMAWQAPDRYYGFANAATWDGRRLSTFGSPFFEIGQDSTGAPHDIDTTLAGMTFTAGGDAGVIPRPADARAFIYPRAFRRDGGATEVLWSEPDFSARSGHGRYVFLLRAATWRGRAWSAPRTIGRFYKFTELTRQMGSDVVFAAGAWHVAFSVDDSATGRHELALVSRGKASWRTRIEAPDSAAIGAVALGADRSELVALVTAIPRLRNPTPGTTIRESVWLSRFNGRSWSSLSPVALSHDDRLDLPQLLYSSSGLLAAWIRDGATPALEWRSIGRDGEMGPVQRLEGVLLSVSGLEGLRDLLSVSMTDGTGRVLRLRSDGFDEVGRYPARNGFVFIVAGSPDRPLALVSDTTTRAGFVWPYLAAYELRCGKRDGEAPRRR